MENKRLALICQHFYPEMISTGMHMTELATGLSRQGYRLRVYCTQPVYRDDTQNKGAVPQRMAYEGIEIIRVPTLANPRGSLLERAINALTYLLMTVWCLFRNRRELVGVINTTNPPFLGLAACCANYFAKLPFVTIVYDVYPEVAICVGSVKKGSLIAKVWEQVTRLILNQSEGLVVIGRDMAQLVRQKLKEPDSANITLIPNWSDAERVYSCSSSRKRV